LGKIDVVRDDDVGAHVGVQVIIGTPEQCDRPCRPLLSYPALDASTITEVHPAKRACSAGSGNN
jgi:hypothetical protein